MRADFRRFYGIPFSDVVRGRVPLSEGVSLFVDLLHNPESSVSRVLNDDEQPWSIGDYLTAHVWSALTGEKHPALPKNASRSRRDPKREAKRLAALDRKRQRERDIAEGRIT